MKTFRISHYSFSHTDTLLFDANIWLFIHSPQYRPSDQRTVIYSTALRKILEAGSRIVIDALVFSEFVNVLARYAYNALPPQTKPNDFKTFRKSNAFKPVARDIACACRRVLEHAIRTDSEFPLLNIEELLSDYAAGKTDFTDQMLAELCRRKGFKLVTDDGDFKGSSFTILTENRRLLR